MDAIHLEPTGSTYAGTKEEFLPRTPLPLTDLTVGHDGSLCFAVGGRRGQSELYRVRYAGSEPTTPVDARVALEHQPIELWRDRALSTGNALGRITAGSRT